MYGHGNANADIERIQRGVRDADADQPATQAATLVRADGGRGRDAVPMLQHGGLRECCPAGLR